MIIRKFGGKTQAGLFFYFRRFPGEQMLLCQQQMKTAHYNQGFPGFPGFRVIYRITQGAGCNTQPSASGRTANQTVVQEGHIRVQEKSALGSLLRDLKRLAGETTLADRTVQVLLLVGKRENLSASGDDTGCLDFLQGLLNELSIPEERENGQAADTTAIMYDLRAAGTALVLSPTLSLYIRFHSGIDHLDCSGLQFPPFLSLEYLASLSRTFCTSDRIRAGLPSSVSSMHAIDRTKALAGDSAEKAVFQTDVWPLYLVCINPEQQEAPSALSAKLPGVTEFELQHYGGFSIIQGLVSREAERRIQRRIRSLPDMRMLMSHRTFSPWLLLLRLLRRKHLRLGVAESCTGGMVGELLTALSGVSAVFQGSIVTYSNAAKESLLGVSRKTLEDRGAVSEETALEMAAGARAGLDADIAVAITGIAGPGGGSEEKPVGTVCFAAEFARPGEPERPVQQEQKRMHFAGDRASVRREAAWYALSLLFTVLLKGRAEHV